MSTEKPEDGSLNLEDGRGGRISLRPGQVRLETTAQARERYQREKPTLEQALAEGGHERAVPLGELLDRHAAIAVPEPLPPEESWATAWIGCGGDFELLATGLKWGSNSVLIGHISGSKDQMCRITESAYLTVRDGRTQSELYGVCVRCSAYHGDTGAPIDSGREAVAVMLEIGFSGRRKSALTPLQASQCPAAKPLPYVKPLSGPDRRKGEIT